MGGERYKDAILSRNMTTLRESRGLTIRQVCVDLNISLKSMEQWEAGRTRFPYMTLARLCSYYRYTDIYKLITVEMRFSFNPIFQKCG